MKFWRVVLDIAAFVYHPPCGPADLKMVFIGLSQVWPNFFPLLAFPTTLVDPILPLNVGSQLISNLAYTLYDISIAAHSEL